MKLKILGWSSRGFRCPDIEIQLIDDNGKTAEISLLQMPNGTGKTTTLDLLRAAMNGKARSWSYDKVREFRRTGSDEENAIFVLFLSVDDSPLTIEMNFDFLEGEVHYRTSRPGSGGIEKGYNPPVEVRRFLDDRFIELFFFDGELAANLLERDKTAASEAIYAMCHLYLFDDMTKIATAEEKRKIFRTVGRKTQKGLTIAKNRLKKLKATEVKLKKGLSEAKETITAVDAEIADLKGKKDQIDSKHEDIKQQLESAKKRADTFRADIDLSCADIMGLYRSPHNLNPRFKAKLVSLKEGFDKLKLPESTSKEFFNELSCESMCICNRPIGKEEKEAILENSKKYMGSETAGVLNAFKSKISDFSDNDHEVPAKLKGLNELIRSERDAIAEVDIFEQKLIQVGGDKAAEIKAKIDELETKRQSHQELVDVISRGKDHPDCNELCLAWVKAQIEDAKDKIAIITETLGERRKHSILNKIFDRAVELSKENLKEAIISESNKKLATVLESDVLQIASIDSCINLEGNQAGASVGQTLAIGYCFLTTLLERGNNEFPLVVDSPCGSMDDARRREIGNVIPGVCSQFLAFIIKTECQYFADSLDASSSVPVNYMTAFRSSTGTRALEESLPEDNVYKTSNGVLVRGKKYFDEFELVTEV